MPGLSRPDVNGFGFPASLELAMDGAADLGYNDLNSLAGRIGARSSRTWETDPATVSEAARIVTV